jgi:hypothetical protein
VLNKTIYLQEIERIMDIRCGRGNWCFYAVPQKFGANIGTCGEEEAGYTLLVSELFHWNDLISAENEAHELNRSRLGIDPARSSVICAKAVALAAFMREDSPRRRGR